MNQAISLRVSRLRALVNFGLTYIDQGDFTKAIDCYSRSLTIFEELGDKQGIANSLNNIGIIYKDQGDFAKALENLSKALSIAQKIGAVETIKFAMAI